MLTSNMQNALRMSKGVGETLQINLEKLQVIRNEFFW
jgi:hypothetical protein